MEDILEPINMKSLKDEFISRFEKLILSGKIKVGEKLPSERDLAKQLKVSRPVVHDGLLDLANKGLIRMVPRRGAYVNDFRRYGSMDLILSLVNYQGEHLDKDLMDSLLQLRELFEVEAARLAAINYTDEEKRDFEEILEREKAVDPTDLESITDLDYRFHLAITLASGNMLFPLLLNSVKVLYTNYLREFFRDDELTNSVFRYHEELVNKILSRDSEGAAQLMRAKLHHAQSHMGRINQNIKNRVNVE